jgi:hypothetical protein
LEHKMPIARLVKAMTFSPKQKVRCRVGHAGSRVPEAVVLGDWRAVGQGSREAGQFYLSPETTQSIQFYRMRNA